MGFSRQCLLLLSDQLHIFKHLSLHQCKEKSETKKRAFFSTYYLQCHLSLLFGTETENLRKKTPEILHKPPARIILIDVTIWKLLIDEISETILGQPLPLMN